jgi:hypothetical protein
MGQCLARASALLVLHTRCVPTERLIASDGNAARMRDMAPWYGDAARLGRRSGVEAQTFATTGLDARKAGA